MKLFVMLVCLGLTLSAQTPQEPRTVEVPLLSCAGLPCLDMSTASGKTLRLLIDLGEANSYLDTKTAQALGVNLQGLKTDANTAVSQVQQTVVPGAKIGDLPMGDFPFMVMDTTLTATATDKNPPPFPADGALTFRAFLNRILQIDYADRKVRISEPLSEAQPCPQACSTLVPKHVGNWGPVTLTTPGFTVDGQAVDAQIDTLFKGTMVIYPDAVKKLGMKKLAKAKRKEMFPFFQNGLKLSEAENASFAWQSVQLGQDMPLYFFTKEDYPGALDYDATVGSGLFTNATAVFDLKAMKFWVTASSYPPSPSR